MRRAKIVARSLVIKMQINRDSCDSRLKHIKVQQGAAPLTCYKPPRRSMPDVKGHTRERRMLPRPPARWKDPHSARSGAVRRGQAMKGCLWHRLHEVSSMRAVREAHAARQGRLSAR
eukprot:12278359-Alexandrium_andersonii.AAC.1